MKAKTFKWILNLSLFTQIGLSVDLAHATRSYDDMDDAYVSGAFLFPNDSVHSMPARKINVPRPQSRPLRVAPGPQGRSEAVSCGNCWGARASSGSRPERLAALYPQSSGSRGRITFRTRGKPIGANCRSLFMDQDGQFGPLGNSIARLMSSPAYQREYLEDVYSLSKFCPRYRSFLPQQRIQAWVWFWMVLANEESTNCDPDEEHKTHYPDGRRMNRTRGFGLYAAELYPQERNWRGPMCRGNIRNVQTQINCAVHTMAATQLRRGRGVQSNGSYWGPVRNGYRQIIPNMRGFQSCF